MICVKCYEPVRELEWSSHTKIECNEKKTKAINGEVSICQEHPQEDAPALLLGRICPLCSPDIKLRGIDPDLLCGLQAADSKKTKGEEGIELKTIQIYAINSNSQLCNYLDSKKCQDIACWCKKANNSCKNLTQQFWLNYKSSVKHPFDHSVIFKPYARDTLSENTNDQPQSPSLGNNNDSLSENTNDPAHSPHPPNSPPLSDNNELNEEPLVTIHTMPDADLYGFAIRNPPDTVLPSTFMLANINEILNVMKS